NTVQAYGRDLARFAAWTTLVRFANYTKPTLKDLARYVAFLHDEQLAPPSIARHLVALKMFYRFLKMEERADAAAVDLLGSPKLWERIPQVLSPAAVDALLQAPQAGDRFFLRDRAILETLNATAKEASSVWCRWGSRRLPPCGRTSRSRRKCWPRSAPMSSSARAAGR